MLDILAYPDPRLLKTARPLTDEEINGGLIEGLSLGQLVDQMTALMRAGGKGVGLAAPQVGVLVRLFLCDISASNSPTPVPLVFVNPELSDFRGEVEMFEGCLSLPGIELKIKRPQMVKVKAKNIHGKEFEIDANGGLARVIQHEHDHLSGKLITTRTSIIGNKKVKEALDQMERAHTRWQERQKRKAEKAEKKNDVQG